MSVSYEGIGYLAVTLPNRNCTVGQLCTLNLSGQGVNAGDGETFLGVVEAVDGKKMAVQIEGFVTMKYSGTAPSLGYVKLSSNGNGGVRVNNAGREYLVLECNNDTSTVIMKL